MNDSSSEKRPDSTNSTSYDRSLQRYWSGTLKIMIGLLLVWAIAGLGCGILFADFLNEFTVGGFRLGFWFAQQGSIIVFVFVILGFCLIMNARDKKHAEELKSEGSQSGGGI